MPIPIRQEDMENVFRVTDELGIHREALTVPLARQDPGEVRQTAPGQFRIVLPESIATEEWTQGPMREAFAALGYEELP